eukprot:scaffold2246_cov162-Amphora_coffeaeformis.AAC.21
MSFVRLALLVAVILFASQTATITALSVVNHNNNNNNNNSKGPPVQVYDHVIPTATHCRMLHELAVEHASRGLDGSSIFYRRPSSSMNDNTIVVPTHHPNHSSLLTPLEVALDSILEQLGDPHPIVEYWSRQEYLNMDAHADIDEEELQDDGTLRYPAAGHVLYLGGEEGDKVQETPRGPTAIFPTQQGGWITTTTTATNDDIPLVIVPAVPGRVLKFPGSSLHAVPKPVTRWWWTPREQVAWDDNQVEEEDDYDDEEDEEEEYDQRSVILFNTWDNRGPRGVPVDSGAGLALPDGIALEGMEEQEFLQQQQQRRQQEWEERYGPGMRDLKCTKQSDWKHVPIHYYHTPPPQPQQPSSSLSSSRRPDDNVIISLPLMGNRPRRLHPDKFVSLQVSSSALHAALHQENQTTQIDLNVAQEGT